MQSCVPFELPYWIKGIGGNRAILLLSPDCWDRDSGGNDTIQQVFIHEYLHLAVFDTFRQQCPLWLNEGLAQIIAEQVHFIESIKLKTDVSLYQIGYDDSDFYNQSAKMVSCLVEQHGLENIIKRAMKCEDFYHDDIFGVANLERTTLI